MLKGNEVKITKTIRNAFNIGMEQTQVPELIIPGYYQTAKDTVEHMIIKRTLIELGKSRAKAERMAANTKGCARERLERLIWLNQI